PSDWMISGAIVCPCAGADRKTGLRSEVSPTAVPDEVRMSIREQIAREEAAHAKARDEALIAKYGDPSRLGAAERRMADRNGDGTVSAMEMASFAVTRDLFRHYDRNGDGVISLEEYLGPAIEELSKLMRTAAARYSAGDKERMSLSQRALLAGA